MERMAPGTPSVRVELSRRAVKVAEAEGLQVGTLEYYQFCQRYVDSRNIPPLVIEDVLEIRKSEDVLLVEMENKKRLVLKKYPCLGVIIEDM